METASLLLFIATILPLICTPGPDMLFVVSQSLSGGTPAGLRGTAGVCLGYLVHSLLVALGLAAVIAASPVLFELLRLLGVGYLLYLAVQLIRTAMKAGEIKTPTGPTRAVLRRGFLTAVLNPKGMMIYFAILPQFMTQGRDIVVQAATLSLVFVALCGIVYAILSFAVGAAKRTGRFGSRHRRVVQGGAGGLLVVAAAFMAFR
ncbi:MAG: LysE family translocator [Rhizobiaceae bacterium]|nr:LysE family translocator [Rhizobiaceae bacterium]